MTGSAYASYVSVVSVSGELSETITNRTDQQKVLIKETEFQLISKFLRVLMLSKATILSPSPGPEDLLTLDSKSV